ncbi:hypothetical protein CIL03_15870 [Virgibacillus indicus]|uniref:Uncharacterized protein n=1 Tax=Virgibacillus indicus TaxID=2024554 RepID=A0A265N7Z1_9BACI|nr:hypothetical protein [Virgibacillus indicus]OZU87569.1 hypothetical protein CIL03_15870 [Virgibacillus indicus]
MVIAGKLIEISIIVLSLAAGFISFYILSDLSKKQKKRQIDELTSKLVNFVIFIWIGKIILNFSIFIKDPLAILAYPSDSDSFYIAVLFTAIILAYKSIRKKMKVPAFMESFLHVFLIASFLYEFIQLVWNDNTYAFGYLILLAVLLVLFFLTRERLAASLTIMVMLIGWSAGVLVLTLIQPFVTVFGYIMEPWFLIVFFIINISIIIFKMKLDRQGTEDI